MTIIFPLRWGRIACKKLNHINVRVIAIDESGNTVTFTKEYREWFGVCTGNIKKVVFYIKKYFPTCQVSVEKLSDRNFKKVLPYFKDRIVKNKLSYSSKPFYKVYTTASVEDVGCFFNKKKISYYGKEDWLARIYIDFCTRYDTSEFYYKWYNVHEDKSSLMDSFEMLPLNNSIPNITVAAFDLETVPLDGKNRVPTGHDASDRIVMISLVKWSPIKMEKTVLYLNPSSESLQLPQYLEFFDEKSMLLKFHSMIRDAHVLTGYNINNFDLPCIVARLTWLNMRSVLRDYSSRKIGKYIVTTFLDKLVVDMFNFIEMFSNYDLPSFKLDDVAKFKMGSKKVEMKTISIHCWYGREIPRSLLLSKDTTECFDALKPRYVREEEFGTFLTCLKYCLRDSELVHQLFNHEMALDFLISRSNFTALSIEQSLYCGNSKYIFDVVKTYGTNLGFFVNTDHFENTVVEDGEDLQSFFIGKNRSTYQGALNFCVPNTYHENVFVFDFTSMYPSILLNHNLCYGTCSIMSLHEYDALPEEIRKQCAIVPYRNHSENEFLTIGKFPADLYRHPELDRSVHKAVMVWYKEELGFLPHLVQHFLAKRKEYRKMKGVINHNKQLNIKLFLNSIYGCMASTDTVFARLYIAMIITGFARIYLLACAEYFARRNKTIAYSDTDSIFVVGYGIDNGDAVNAYLNQPHMTLAFERIMDSLMLISKKRYIYECNGKIYKKGFEKKSNELVKCMSENIIKSSMSALRTKEKDFSAGCVVWVETLVRAYSMCKNPRKYCITRKTKPLSEYKSTTCPQLRILRRHPEKAGQYIDFTYSQADISFDESKKWVMEVEECDYVNFEKLFVSQKKIFVMLLNEAFFGSRDPRYMCNMVLNTMKWKHFLNAEFKSFKKTGENIMILVERGIKYTFQINDC